MCVCREWSKADSDKKRRNAYLKALDNFPFTKIKNQEPKVARLLGSFLIKGLAQERGLGDVDSDLSTANFTLTAFKDYLRYYVVDDISSKIAKGDYLEGANICVLHSDFSAELNSVIRRSISDKKKAIALEVIRMQSSVDPALMAEWIEEFIPSDAYTVTLFRRGYGQFSFEVFDIEYEGYFFEYAEICIKYGLFD